MTPILLAIESSQRDASVAAGPWDQAEPVDSEPIHSGKRHDDDALAAIDRLWSRQGWARTDLDAVAVSIGPGGFTGLRIAVATAKGLAIARGAKVIAAPSALTIAMASAAPTMRRVLVLLAAKRGRAWAVVAERQEGSPWRLVDEGGVIGRSEIDAAAPGLDGVIADAYAPEEMIDASRAGGCPIIEPVTSAAAVWRFGRARLESGDVDDSRTLAPWYPREPEAVTIWRERRGQEKS